MKDSYLTAGITFGQLVRLLRRNRISYTPATLSRMFFLFQSSVWSSLFATAEKIRFGKELAEAIPPRNPIFIIGHWRTGSTLLHKLLSLDPSMLAPTLFQVAIPDSFLLSYKYYKPVFKTLIDEHRPMDMVRIGMDEPQEDEYAIYRLTNYSPLEKLVFPTSSSYFLKNDLPFLPADELLVNWSENLVRYFAKLQMGNSRTIVSKNPFNSFRIKLLTERFPDAKFIHILRHPYNVVPSTINMWNIVQKQNALTKFKCRFSTEPVAGFLEFLLHTIEKDRNLIRPGNFFEIRFEDLEKDTVSVLRDLYTGMGHPFPEDLQRQIKNYMDSNADFKKNEFTLSSVDKEIIANKLTLFMDRYSYPH
ncbi:MAG TPA: sulfotransferase [Bacteroidales bacterium]|nr:sulfotransferase [Bacteroidales bacterium]HPS50788.1 sulfotransferase [Bacteroidales bacterium]